MRVRAFMLVASLSISPALAQEATTKPDNGSSTIIVTARPLSKLVADLAACRARGCPPAEDMRLSLEAAEAQFVAGPYRDARGTLRSSIERNRSSAKAHAPLLASLHRASARISQHYGNRDDYASSTYEIARTLRQAYPDDSPELILARIEAADMLVRTGSIGRARQAYENLVSQTKRLGLGAALTTVELRLAWIEMFSGRELAGKARLQRIAASGATDPHAALAVDVVKLRLARLRGRDAEAEQHMRSIMMRTAGTARPQLVSAPTVDLDRGPEPIVAAADDRIVKNGGTPGSIGSPERSWIDVGYWITPEGKVSDAEILRAAREGRWWHARVLDALGRRQYTPYKSPDGQPGFYRIERFTLNAWYRDFPGSRIARRDGEMKIESLDLTPETSAVPAS